MPSSAEMITDSDEALMPREEPGARTSLMSALQSNV